jgi:hypothetical protein
MSTPSACAASACSIVTQTAVRLQRLGDGVILIRRRHRSSSTVQPFCFTLSQRFVGPPGGGHALRQWLPSVSEPRNEQVALGIWTAVTSPNMSASELRIPWLAHWRGSRHRGGTSSPRENGVGTRYVGASTSDRQVDHLRERVRRFVNRHELPRVQAGYNTTPKLCASCGRSISRGSPEFDIAFAAFTFVLDAECFGLWQEEMGPPKEQGK